MCATDTYRFWWADVGTRRAPKTARLYRYHLLRFFADIGRDPMSVGEATIRDYLDTISHQHAESVRSALSDYFDWTVRRGLRPHNPLVGVQRRHGARRRIRRGLDDPELARLIVAACYLGHGRTRWTPGGTQLAWIITALAHTGLRPGEFCGLHVSDVHLDQPRPWLRVYASKTDQERAVPLNRAAREAFSHLIAGREGQIVEIGVTALGTKIRRAALAAGLPDAKARTYALRHSFATRLIERRVPDRIVAELLGHTDVRHMVTYTQPGDPQLRAAVDVLDGEGEA